MSTETLMTLNFTLNGEAVTAQIQPHHTLLEVIRDRFGLYGARESCGQGMCGCCTLVVNGKSVSGCLYLAAFAGGAQVATVEGLEQGGKLSPIQEAFIECGAFQCGFCTSGFIMMAQQLLDENPDPSEDQIRHYLSGNLCRCGTYPEIIKAIRMVAQNGKAVA